MSGQSTGPGARPRSRTVVAFALVWLAAQASATQEKAMPPIPAADEPYRVGGAVTRPEKISGTAPVYTELARKARLQGVVILEAIIDELGDVTDVKVLKGLPLGLDLAAVEAIKTWKFHPAILEGKPVKVYYTLTVNFQLDGSPFRGPAFFKFLSEHPDFAAALSQRRYTEAAALLDLRLAERPSDPEIVLARVYLLLEQDLLDDAWQEAQGYDGAHTDEVLRAVTAFALGTARRATLDEAARAQVVELGLEAATRAIEAKADAVDALQDKSLLLQEKAKLAPDPDERRRLADEAAQLDLQVMELRRAKAATAGPAAPETQEPQE